jgi:hypothetical protein
MLHITLGKFNSSQSASVVEVEFENGQVNLQEVTMSRFFLLSELEPEQKEKRRKNQRQSRNVVCANIYRRSDFTSRPVGEDLVSTAIRR